MPHKNLEELYRIHKNKPVAIIGNSPTTILADQEKLSKITTIAPNSKIWHPEYYDKLLNKYVENPVIPNYVVFSEGQEFLEPRSKDVKILYAQNSCNLGKYSTLLPEYDTYKFTVKRYFLDSSLSLAEHPDWKKKLRIACSGITGKHNTSFPMVFGGLTTPINIAFWMGANPIYLVGFDGGPVDGRYHFWTKDVDSNSIYHRDSAMVKRIFQGQLKYLHVCKTLFATCGVDIYCSTKGSRYLKALDYADLPSI